MSLSLLILLAPATATAYLFTVKPERKGHIRRVAIGASLVTLVGAILMWTSYDPASTEKYQFLTEIEWAPSLGLALRLGADGISMAMVLLTAFVIFTGTLISRAIEQHVKEHYILLMALVTGVFGVFLSLDLFFFYFFYEMAVIPMFLLIGVWGSQAAKYSKEYATMKLTLYLTAGAVLALVGLLAVYFKGSEALWGQTVKLAGESFTLETGTYTFDMRLLEQAVLPAAFQNAWFPVVFLGFACIIPMWPLHSWSPIGHAAAPSAVSMLHAGVLMKLGAYGVLRLGYGLLPAGAEHWMGWVALLCCMNIIYGGMVAMAQRDMKFIIGFSSSSHMGYVLLGLATLGVTGVTGAVFLMFAHGIMTALAFALVGYIYDQTHTRVIDDWGGLMKPLPFVGTCFVIMAFASAGLPGFANFASELLVIVGSWNAGFELAGTGITVRYLPTIAAIWGLVVTGTYMLRAVRTAFYGETNPRWEGLRDARGWSAKLPFVLLVLVLAYTGFFPHLIVEPIENGVRAVLERVNGASALAEAVR
ncbi:MAG: NADH-quinone oxidoreductase subunit M [Planctomycetota bacterium]|nr:NADH-quinone oxidoreductase subunit M [Planctomycetota bacterium]